MNAKLFLKQLTPIMFYPYDQARVIPLIRLELTEELWQHLSDMLKNYEVGEYINCKEGYFHPEMDNKITILFESTPEILDKALIFISVYDRNVLIGTKLGVATNKNIKCGTLIRK